MVDLDDDKVIEAIKNAVGSKSLGNYTDVKAVYDELRSLLGKNIPLWRLQTNLWKMYQADKIRLAKASTVNARARKYGIHRGFLYFYVGLKEAEGK